METKILFLFLSVVLFYTVIFLVFGIWFRGKQNAYLKIFTAGGIILSTWALFNGIFVLFSEDLYTLIYPYYLILACIVPALLMIYILHFTGSRLARSRVLITIVIAAVITDVTVLVTNPLHHLFIAGYNGLLPIGGAWFPVHAVLVYGMLLFAIAKLIIYAVRNMKKNPALIIVAVAVTLPIFVNILYSFDILNLGFDISPFVFLIMFVVFSLYSARFRIFDNRSTAFMSLFKNFSEPFLIVDQAGYVTDANPSFKKVFPDLDLEFDKTTMEEVVDYFHSIALDQQPEDAIDQLLSLSDEVHNAEVTLAVDYRLYFFVISKTSVFEGKQHVGFVLTMIDVSNNRRTLQLMEEIKQYNQQLVELKDDAEAALKAKTESNDFE